MYPYSDNENLKIEEETNESRHKSKHKYDKCFPTEMCDKSCPIYKEMMHESEAGEMHHDMCDHHMPYMMEDDDKKSYESFEDYYSDHMYRQRPYGRPFYYGRRPFYHRRRPFFPIYIYPQYYPYYMYNPYYDYDDYYDYDYD